MSQLQPKKIEVNCDWSESKTRATLYRELLLSDHPLLLDREFEVLEKPNLRIYCWLCELDITRHAHILTKLEYYCVACFANLEEYPEQYLVRGSLRGGLGGCWSLMDEVVMTTAFKLWGFGNWSQIKEYMDYNGSPFTLQAIEKHFENCYLKQEDQLPVFELPLREVERRPTYGEIAMQIYGDTLRIKDGGDLKRRESKGEKKPQSSMKSLSLISSSREIEVEPPSIPLPPPAPDPTDDPEPHPRPKPDPRTESTILGYNSKRGEFQLGQYDYAAECMLSDLEFYDTDSPEEFHLKLQIIEHYNTRLEERLRRRQFVVEYRLLDSHYHFSQKADGEANSLWQPFMRLTQSHREYTGLVENYSLAKRYERYAANLAKVREKAGREGRLGEALGFMRGKRQKYVANWEKTYGKKFKNRQRRIYEVREGRLQIASGQQDHELDFPHGSEQYLTLSSGSIDTPRGKLKLTPLSSLTPSLAAFPSQA